MTNLSTTARPTFRTDGVWDLTYGLKSWRLWLFLGLQDIRQRYRRSVLGPLWLVLGLGVTVLGIGFLYSKILKAPQSTFIPYLSISLLLWGLISSVITESTQIFISGAGIMSSSRFPYSTFALRCVFRNIIVAGHGAIVVVLTFFFYRYPINIVSLAAIPGLILLVLNLYWISLLIGLMCMRFRDVGQIVLYIIQFAIFVTPVIWMPAQAGENSILLNGNPLYHLINIVRAPLFDHQIPLRSDVVSLVMGLIGIGVTSLLFVRLRRHIIYWI